MAGKRSGFTLALGLALGTTAVSSQAREHAAARTAAPPPAVAPSELEADRLAQALKTLGADPADLGRELPAFLDATREGRAEDADMSASLAGIADAAARDKAESVLRRFAGPSIAEQGPLGGDASKALCNSCATAQSIAAPTPDCQFVSGQTTAACPRDFYAVTLATGSRYTFGFCSCAGVASNYDARLNLRGSGCVIVAGSDDACGLQPQFTYTPAVSGTYVLEVTGYSTSNFGTYRLGYFSRPACFTCASPKYTGLPIDGTCRSRPGTVDECHDDYYAFGLVAGSTYEFSTCPSTPCPGALPLDTVLEAYSPSCTLIATNDDWTGCSEVRGSYLHLTATVTGLHRIRVRGFSGERGSYVLAYRALSECPGPEVLAVTPTSGTAGQLACTAAQAFTVQANGASPMSGTFSIAAPPGARATPASGPVRFAGLTGTFVSSLTGSACGPTAFTILVTVTDACGSDTDSVAYTLSDRTAPTFTSACPAAATVDCAAPVPPAAPMTATDNCDPAPTVTYSETTTAGSCAGNSTIVRTWTARDCSGNARTCRQTIRVRDTTPPAIGPATARCLWPANHEYKCYGIADLSPALTDDCSPPATLRFVACASDEADGGGDGDYPNDCILSPDGLQACMRAERLGNVNDRHYLLTGVATDACGNRSSPQPVALVTVPRDDPHPECDAPDSGLDKSF